MKIFIVILTTVLILLQYRLLVSDQGMREVTRLQSAVETQKDANREQRDHNRQLAAEVSDLKGGMAALEERARSELGMVGSRETFYQVVNATTLVPASPAAAVTARAE